MFCLKEDFAVPCLLSVKEIYFLPCHSAVVSFVSGSVCSSRVGANNLLNKFPEYIDCKLLVFSPQCGQIIVPSFFVHSTKLLSPVLISPFTTSTIFEIKLELLTGFSVTLLAKTKATASYKLFSISI